MIKPFAATDLEPLLVSDERRAELEREASNLPNIVISSAAAAAAVMMGSGYFSPNHGFMNLAEMRSVAETMKLTNGTLWPTPIANLLPADRAADIARGCRIALRDPNVEDEPVLAIQEVTDVEKLSDGDLDAILAPIFGTLDPDHPGVAMFKLAGNYLISGPIEVLNLSYFPSDFPDTFRTAGQIRDEIAQHGWNRVVAFQTRNPMHRAHEELCRMAQQELGADGILIHMLLGKLKEGDIPAHVRDASIRKMVEVYFPKNTVIIAGYGFDMLYAGPREAVLHAIFRQNCGCSHLIVGRDHAGVGDYYGAFDAQAIFDEIPPGSMEIEIYRGDHTAWSKKLNKVVMFRDVPDHKKEDFVSLSGSRVREILSAGEPLPEEFARPEVGQILMNYYQQIGGET